jgi:RNA polymerase sigma factor (sigma-70 family)
MPEYPGDDIVLLLLKNGGAGDAFELIFKKYYRLMWTKAYLGTGDPTDADDLVQSVLCSIWEKQLYYKINGNLRTYLLTAVRNQVNDYHKIKSRRLKRIEKYAETVVDQSCGEEHNVISNEKFQQQLHELLREFPTQRQRAFNLVYLEHKKYNEVADNMGISVNSLKTHLKIAVKTLRNKLDLPYSE